MALHKPGPLDMEYAQTVAPLPAEVWHKWTLACYICWVSLPISCWQWVSQMNNPPCSYSMTWECKVPNSLTKSFLDFWLIKRLPCVASVVLQVLTHTFKFWYKQLNKSRVVSRIRYHFHPAENVLHFECSSNIITISMCTNYPFTTSTMMIPLFLDTVTTVRKTLLEKENTTILP